MAGVVGIRDQTILSSALLWSKLSTRCRHDFQMPLMIPGETQHHVAHSSACIALQPLCEASLWAGIPSLPAPRHGSRLPVILFKILVEPFIRPAAVLIDTYGKIHRAGERVFIAPCRACDFLDLLP